MKINVGVIYGGESVEHEVSIISAMQGMNALDKERYNVVPIYISKNKQIYSSEELMDMDSYKDLDQLVKKVPQVFLYKENQKVLVKTLEKKLFQKEVTQTLDVVIPILHGTNGEDGTVQGYLELLGVPYSGCDVIAAGVGQDKVIMKHVLENSGVPICDWTWFYYHDFEAERKEILEKIEKIGYPVVVKPACLGSSVGITVAGNEKEVLDAIDTAGQYDFKVVVEKGIVNLKEINCSVLGDSFESKASVLEEVTKSDTILSYQDKYEGNAKGSKGMVSAQRIIPAPIGDKRTKEIQDLAIKTFKVLGASGVCRIDFMIDEATDELYVNEINTIPGSLAFYLWEPVGVNFMMLMDALINQAIERQRRKEKMYFSYDTNILANFKSSASKGAKR